MTKGEAFLMYRNSMPEDECLAFDRWLRSNAVISSLFCFALLVIAIAGDRSSETRTSNHEGGGQSELHSSNTKSKGVESNTFGGGDLTSSIQIVASSILAEARIEECAARDLRLFTEIEEHGNLGSVPAERLAAAYSSLLQARIKCRANAAEGIRRYGEIELNIREASAIGSN